MRRCWGIGALGAVRCCTVALSAEARQSLTTALSRVRDESRGQALDLADMGEASRILSRALQDALLRAQIEDETLSGKLKTLSASIKAHTNRVSNLQSESKSIDTQVTAILKLMWGTDAAPNQGGSSASATTQSSTDTTVEAESDKGSNTAAKDEKSQSPDQPQVGSPEVISVESIEVESSAEAISIPDITRELHEANVDFSDCNNTESLRARYQQYLDRKKAPPTPKKEEKARTASPDTSAQPPPPPKYDHAEAWNQQQQRSANTTEKTIAHDPYPNAQRRMVDPMKYIYEIKMEVAKENGVDPANVDLWCGYQKLDDHKRMCDYPAAQTSPIEIRAKGDVPQR